MSDSTAARRWALTHPVLFGVLVMVAWKLVVYGFGSLDIPALQPGWFPGLGVVVTNGLGAAVALAIGWRFGMLSRSALGWGRVSAYPWTLPLLAIAVSYLVLGRGDVPGIAGTLGALLSSAVAMASVGASEEIGGRGVGLAAADPRRPYATVVVVAVVFGVGHIGNYLLYGASLDDTIVQICSATAAGFCWGAGRFYIASIWPCALVHALSNWAQINSPGAAPFWYQVAVMAFLIGYGIWTLRLVARRAADVAEPALRT